MNLFIEQARDYEEKKSIKNAINAYIKAFSNGEVFTQDDILNAIVIFFLAQDYGYKIEYDISDEIQTLAWSSYLKIIKTIDCAEAHFWKKYIQFIVMGEDICDSEIKNILHEDLTPLIYFITFNQTDDILEKAKLLLEKHMLLKTERSRYIYSILDKYLNNKGEK